jgi:arginine decarboxylase
VFRDHGGDEAMPEGTAEGDVRRAFYLSYDDTNCEDLTGEEFEAKLDAGVDVLSATFVTP